MAKRLMKKLVAVLFFAMMLSVTPANGQTHGGGGHGGHPGGGHPGNWHDGGSWHGGGWHGSGWYGGVFIGAPWFYPYSYYYPYPYGYYPYSYGAAPYYAYPPPAIEGPSVYIEREPAPSAAPPAQTYWYYCASAKAYYPSVPRCPEAWIKVPPPPQ